MNSAKLKLVEGLSFDHTVHRKLVHKHALDEAFITGWQLDGDGVRLAAVLPRAHALYNEFPAEDRVPDLAVITEVCRQACFVVAHTKFAVPVIDNTFQFLLQEINSSFLEVERLPKHRPIELIVDCTIEQTRRRGRELSALVWRFHVTDRSGEVPVADVRMRMVWIDRGDWRRMRDSMRRGRGLPIEPGWPQPPAAGLPPDQVGRRNVDNVALQTVDANDIERSGYQALARIDSRHPVLFDHLIDHVYAMVQLEACRQLGLHVHARAAGVAPAEIELAGFTAEFHTVAELDLPVHLYGTVPQAGSDGMLTHRVQVCQGERQNSSFTLTTRPRRHFVRG